LLLQVIVSGIIVGSIYALVALGFILIYKGTNIMNFAQGEMVMISAYFGLMYHIYYKMPYLAAFILTLLTAGICGILIERIVCRPLLKSPVMSVIIATIAVSIIIKNIARLVWGSIYYPFPSPFSLTPYHLGPIMITPKDIGTIVITLILLGMLYYLLQFTKIGAAMLATASNQKAASIMGISIKRVFSLTWAISFGLASAAGFLLAPQVSITPEMGDIVIVVFTAAVLGGLESLTGAVVGGVLLGIVGNLAGFYISTAFKDVVSFLILITILMFKPSGLFSRGAMRKA